MTTNRASQMTAARSNLTVPVDDESTFGALKWAFKNVLQAIFTVTWTSFWVSTALVVLCLTFQRDWALALARKAWGPGMFWAAQAKLDVTGLEDLDPHQPYIFMANHQSIIDIPVGFTGLGRDVRYIAKKELAKVPFIGWYVWAMGMIFVDRKNVDKAIASLDKAAEIINEGASVIAFPEGTRSRDGVIRPFKKGTFLLAINAGVPIVPVAIHGAADVAPCDGFRIRPGTIRVNVGAPIKTAGMTNDDRDALIRSVHDAIIDLHLEVGGEGGPREPAVALSRREAAEAKAAAEAQKAA